ncbi:hypothetical protein DGMP_09010 [Desulfomarina profundi]|uniref:Uncharacterized protein n=1 Tax=Desulfomarina profundi TaxID=2772557 RepID=A0A8D5FF73_9BACT|nr:hypothetical protein DGMP_09010 [Desulfomarina profundi]
MGACRQAYHLVGGYKSVTYTFFSCDSFDDQADRCGDNVEHLAEWQPREKCTAGKNMEKPEKGYSS